MRRYLLAILFVLLITSCVAADQSYYYLDRPPTKDSDYTWVTAVVTRVTRFAYPHVRLDLDVSLSSNTDILDITKDPHTITVFNYLWSNLKDVAWDDPRNIGSIGAFYLLQGDEIHAKLFAGSTSSVPWYIYGVGRTGCGVKRQPSSGVKVYGDLQLALETDREIYPPDRKVTMTFSVTNIGSALKTLEFGSAQHYDFIISRDGAEVWRWSRGRVFTQALTSVSLAPGQTLRFTETWSQVDNLGHQVEPGEYNVTGILTIRGAERPSTGPVSIIIEKESSRTGVYDNTLPGSVGNQAPSNQ